MTARKARLILKDGSSFDGKSFGYPASVAGEVIFTTGMMGYPESISDPSYRGQILIFSFPLIGNYGVPSKDAWESGQVNATAIVVSTYINDNSHQNSTQSLGNWLNEQKVPGIEIKDTRLLTQKL